MATTPNFALPLIPGSSNQPHVPANAALTAIDAALAEFLAVAPGGAKLVHDAAEAEVTLAGASVATAALIPDRAIVSHVATRVLTALTGATNFDLGIAGSLTRYGAMLGGNLGDTNIGGTSSPLFYYGDTPLVLTGRASGGGAASFTGGRVRVVVFFSRVTNL